MWIRIQVADQWIHISRFQTFSTGAGKVVNWGQHWNNAEIAALLDIWRDDKIQSQLDGAYRNDSVSWKIVAALASHGDTHDPATIFFFAMLESSVVILLQPEK